MMDMNFALQLEQHLPFEQYKLIQLTGKLARELDMDLYLVGGAVRDLLLGQDITDIDLVVEGNAIELAKLLSQRRGGKILVHQRFGTAKVSIDKTIVDFATARSETYASPGALPTVCPGSFNDDLRRRDFTINAMAINLGINEFGHLIDPYNGQNDLKHRNIRVLHHESFRDDATRMIRALRYEQRLEFKLEPATESLLLRDIDMLDTISGDRLRHELELILKESMPEKVLKRCEEIGVLNKIYPSLKISEWIEKKFELARSVSTSAPLSLYLPILLYPFNQDNVEKFISRLKIPNTIARSIRESFQVKEISSALNAPDLSFGDIYSLLSGFQPQAIQVNAMATDSFLVNQRLNLYLEKLRYVKPWVNGKTLQQMGISSGPQMGELISVLRKAKLDQKVKTKEEEIELVRKWQLSKNLTG